MSTVNKLTTLDQTPYHFSDVQGKSMTVRKVAEIGGGASANVYKVVRVSEEILQDPQPPKIPEEYFALKEYVTFPRKEEFEIGKTLQHKHIVSLLGYEEKSPTPSESQKKSSIEEAASSEEEQVSGEEEIYPHGYLLMELVEGELMQKFLEDPASTIEEKEFLLWSSQLVNVLNYCIQQNVVPVDFNSSNIIITPNRDLKIVDLGRYTSFEKCEEGDLDHLFDTDEPFEIEALFKKLIQICPSIQKNFSIPPPIFCPGKRLPFQGKEIIGKMRDYIVELTQWNEQLQNPIQSTKKAKVETKQ